MSDLRAACIHGRYEECGQYRGSPYVPCPGGREVTIDYEAVASSEHNQWTHWTIYMLDNLTDENIARWRQQTKTPYSELTEREKESDREWARKAVAAAIGDTG